MMRIYLTKVDTRVFTKMKYGWKTEKEVYAGEKNKPKEMTLPATTKNRAKIITNNNILCEMNQTIHVGVLF